MYKKVKPYFALLIVIVCISLFSSGCGINVGYSSGSSTKSMSASFTSLTDTKEKTIELKSGNILSVDHSIKLEAGTLDIKLQDSEGNELTRFEPNTQGKSEINIGKDGVYKIIIKGFQAKGSYKFEWSIK